MKIKNVIIFNAGLLGLYFNFNHEDLGEDIPITFHLPLSKHKTVQILHKSCAGDHKYYFIINK